MNLYYVVMFAGWLKNRPANQETVILETFETVWEIVFRYVVQTLNAKMQVITFQTICCDLVIIFKETVFLSFVYILTAYHYTLYITSSI